jgi:hypothetical protein
MDDDIFEYLQFLPSCLLFLDISKCTHKKLNTVSCTFMTKQSVWHVRMYGHLFEMLSVHRVFCVYCLITNFFFTEHTVRWSYRKISLAGIIKVQEKNCFFIIYALQELHTQAQSFPATITSYVFTNNGLKDTPKPTKLININIRLAAFTAAKFTKILLADSCTRWLSKPMFLRWTCLYL